MSYPKFFQPQLWEELVLLLGEATPQTVIIAGGTDILAKMNEERQPVDCFISLARLKEMKELKETPQGLYLGAMLNHDTLAHNTLIKSQFPALAQACASVGSQQIRNRGTLGGNLVNASLAGDTILCLFLFNALVEIINARGSSRVILANEFVLRSGKTVLAPGEVVKGVILPKPQKNSGSVFHKIGTRSKVTVAKISLGLSWQQDGNQAPNQFSAYIGAIPPKPVPVEAVNEILGNKMIGKEAKDALAKEVAGIIKKMAPDREYKIRAAKGLVYDALEMAFEV